ncbi:MAG TPA: 5-methyltetrahydrofolate--homocysteine methyltransferase, partial [Peptococcaceae bacterium]|nr:5-methyltetrahydrofolate--homocysteine methyltransferase [Peptococcaceae bacterium]
MHSILDALQKNVIVGDGAMGTMLQTQGLPKGQSPEVWMLSQPEEILNVHKAYADAGAQIFETNTFGANTLKLQEYGYENRLREINQLAARLARQAAGPKGYVAGLIGPTGHFPRPIGDHSFLALKEIFRDQIQILAESGVDMIYLQTFSDLGEARAALLAAKETTHLPVAVSLT